MKVGILKNHLESIPHLSIKEALCYTESMKQTEGKPLILRQAEALRDIIENMPVKIREGEFIVGTADETIPVAILKPEGKGLRIIDELDLLSTRKLNPIKVKEEDIELMKKNIYPYWSQRTIETYARQLIPEKIFEMFYKGDAYLLTEIGGLSHVVIDYPRLLRTGLGHYIREAKKKIKTYEAEMSDQPELIDTIAFYKAIVIVAEAAINYAHKYAERAIEISKTELNPTRKQQLQRIAEICQWVPENPPRDFYEAIQFIWFIHLLLHLENIEHGISFGRIDQYLFPYYQKDLGKITREFALELIVCLFLKTNEIIGLFDQVATVFFSGMSTVQGVTIGGVDKDRNDATNELTYVVLEAMEEVAMPSPNLAVRFHKNSPERLYSEIS